MPVTMESFPVLPAAAGIALALLVWAATRWWYRRQIAAWIHRAQKLERKFDAAAQQATQARRQIEKLQRELSEARRTAAIASSQLGSRVASRARAAAPAEAEPAARPQGFADTLPM